MELVGLMSVGFLLIIKVAVIIFLVLHIIFALVVVKQTSLMASTLDVPLDKVMIFVAFLHLLFAIGILVLSFVIL